MLVRPQGSQGTRGRQKSCGLGRYFLAENHFCLPLVGAIFATVTDLLSKYGISAFQNRLLSCRWVVNLHGLACWSYELGSQTVFQTGWCPQITPTAAFVYSSEFTRRSAASYNRVEGSVILTPLKWFQRWNASDAVADQIRTHAIVWYRENKSINSV